MTIRKADLADWETLVAGNCAMALETEELVLHEPTVHAGVRAVLAGGVPGEYRVLEQGGKVVAQLLLTHEWSDWRNGIVWWIQSVYVWPQFRRQGFYRALYASVLEDAERQGVAGVRLYVDRQNQRAQQVYGKLGMNGAHYQVFERMFK